MTYLNSPTLLSRTNRGNEAIVRIDLTDLMRYSLLDRNARHRNSGRYELFDKTSPPYEFLEAN